ncbi:indoleamine 2,3-dioxygenase [halophilic archaeon]|nr:indoleamine 2,3-dioxygenase [halophilic archaeon]
MTTDDEAPDPDRFGVSPERGFLPDAAPRSSLDRDAHPRLRRLDELGERLPSLLERDELGPKVRDLSAPPKDAFDGLSDRELYHVYRTTGFLANAYVNDPDADVETIPAGVAVPLYESTDRLGCTPVLSYDAYVLHNWTRDEPERGLGPPNVRPIAKFASLRDERWFIAVHVAIESAAGPAIAAIGDAQRGVLDDDTDRVVRALHTITDALRDVTAILDRMPERNAPEKYGRAFRPYLNSLTHVEYEGVPELDGYQSYRGASGAQSSFVPALDAALGIDHGDNPLVDHLHELREDMPPAHRAFVEAVEDGPSLRDHVDRADDALRVAYNDCIDQMVTFREHHVDVVETYLVNQLDDTEGTGGTPYGRFLTSFTDDTRNSKLPTS